MGNNVIKKLKQVYSVYAIVLLIFVVYLVMNTIKFIEIHERNGYDYSLKSIFKTISVYGVFKFLVLFTIPVFGVFYRNRLTWVIILIYFYFILWQVVSFSFIANDVFSSTFKVRDILIIIFLLFIPSISIFILNRARTFKSIYNVEKKSLMLFNLIALILGCCISMFVVITSNRHYFNGL